MKGFSNFSDREYDKHENMIKIMMEQFFLGNIFKVVEILLQSFQQIFNLWKTVHAHRFILILASLGEVWIQA